MRRGRKQGEGKLNYTHIHTHRERERESFGLAPSTDVKDQAAEQGMRCITYSFTRSPIHLFIYALAYSLVHLRVRLFTCSFTHSPIHLFIYALAYSLVHLCVRLFTCSPTRSPIHLFTYALAYSLVHLRIRLFICSLTRSPIHLFIYAFAYPLVHLCVRSFIYLKAKPSQVAFPYKHRKAQSMHSHRRAVTLFPVPRLCSQPRPESKPWLAGSLLRPFWPLAVHPTGLCARLERGEERKTKEEKGERGRFSSRQEPKEGGGMREEW